MEVDDDDWDDEDLCYADEQQDDGQTVAEVLVYFAIPLVLDVDSRGVHEYELDTINRCQDGVPKDTIQLPFEPSPIFISSYRGPVTPSMPAL